MLTAQAAGTQIKLFRFPVNHNCSGLDIGEPASFGMLLRMAYPMAKVCRFATDIAFCSQAVNSFSQMRLFSYPVGLFEQSEESKDLSLPLKATGIRTKQVALDNRSRIIPQFPDYTKEKNEAS